MLNQTLNRRFIPELTVYNRLSEYIVSADHQILKNILNIYLHFFFESMFRRDGVKSPRPVW